MTAFPLINTLLASAFLVGVAAAEERTVADFTGTSGLRWQTVNDGVMGGRSRGGPEVTDQGSLLFTGDISLENNGGFSSVRTRPKALALKGFDGLSLRLKGDGRSYRLSLRTQGTQRMIAYWADLETKNGEWSTVRVPFSAFVPTAFGRRLPGPALNVARVNSVGFMLYDKKAGPFALEVDSISAYNGAVPAVDALTIVDVAAKAGTFKTLLAAAKAAGLVETLSGAGPLTVFAPTDEAFAKLPAGTVEGLLQPGQRDALARILKHHVVSGAVYAGQALTAEQAKTVAGTTLKIRYVEGSIRIDGARVVAADVPAANGVIHVIDSVLLPPARVQAKAPKATRPAGSAAERASALIQLAVERGVPLFNAGNVEACAAVYEVAVQGLLAMGDELFGESTRRALRQSLERPAGDDAAAVHAWTLRRALNAALSELRGQASQDVQDRWL